MTPDDSSPGSADVFAEFCLSGLWSGVGPALAATLQEAGIRAPGQVSAAALSGLPKVTDRRAQRLYSAWIGATHSYRVAELLVPQDLPARWVGRLIDALGDGAAGILRADPWRLLLLPDATVAQADRLARSLEPGVARDDPRRGRSLVDWTLARFARQGHTVTPGDQVADAVRPFGVDPVLAIRGAVLERLVTIPSGADGEPQLSRLALGEAEGEISFHSTVSPGPRHRWPVTGPSGPRAGSWTTGNGRRSRWPRPRGCRS